MAEPVSVLFVGESWTTHSIHVKGFDSFTTTEYVEGASELLAGLQRNDIDVTYMPAHVAASDFPYTVSELKQYDVVVLSDIGVNTLLLSRDVFVLSQRRPNRIDSLVEYVHQGGGFVMIGGYLSFSGFEGKAGFNNSRLAEVIPATMIAGDDRAEHPEGVSVKIENPKHSILSGIDGEWPDFLGFNRLNPRDGFDPIATIADHVFLAAGEFGEGRSVVFASDCGPHWGPPEFLAWNSYHRLWKNMMQWSAGQLS